MVSFRDVYGDINTGLLRDEIPQSPRGFIHDMITIKNKKINTISYIYSHWKLLHIDAQFLFCDDLESRFF